MKSTLSYASFAIGVLALAACARSSSMNGVALSGTPDMSTTPPSPDPRVGLSGGWFNAGKAIWNLRPVSMTRPSKDFINESTPGDRRLVNSDLAFMGNYVFQGNYSGWQMWDISNPAKPTLHDVVRLPRLAERRLGLQEPALRLGRGDERPRRLRHAGRPGHGEQRARARHSRLRHQRPEPSEVSGHRADLPRLAHAHARHRPERRDERLRLRLGLGGRALVERAAGCSDALPEEDPNSALFRIEVIQVPLAHPEQAHIVSSPRIFDNLDRAGAVTARLPADSIAAAQRRAAAGRAGGGWHVRARNPALAQRGPTQCHDITVYPAIGLAGGACAGYGLLLDIRDVAHPKRIAAVADSNFSFWHSATFNNDGTKVLFSDEWGGGSQPRCRATDKHEWGADAIFTIDAGQQMTFQELLQDVRAADVSSRIASRITARSFRFPGRDVMVQAWYQGGISVFDWTDASHPKEIAFFDRGPMDATKFVDAGYWSAYWYNGYIVGSEIARGLDLFELKPSAFISQNEIDAAKSVHFDYLTCRISRSSSGRRRSRSPARTSISSRGQRCAERPGDAPQYGAHPRREGKRRRAPHDSLAALVAAPKWGVECRRSVTRAEAERGREQARHVGSPCGGRAACCFACGPFSWIHRGR